MYRGAALVKTGRTFRGSKILEKGMEAEGKYGDVEHMLKKNPNKQTRKQPKKSTIS